MRARVLLDREALRAVVGRLGREISDAYGGDRTAANDVVLVALLRGSVVFLADLIRRLDLPLRIAWIQASSYRGDATTPGELRVRPDLLPDLTGRHVLLLDDILDTGQTLTRVTEALKAMGPRSVRVAVLLRKLGRQQVPFEPDFCGFEIPDEFVVGYGLDYNDEYRHLPHIAVLKP